MTVSLISSDEINYLILRYLQESGFSHTAFALKNEMQNANVLESSWALCVPTGHLINKLQQSLMYEEVMSLIDENGVEKEVVDFVPPTLIPGNVKSALNSPVENGHAPSSSNKAATNVSDVTAISATVEKSKKTPPVSAKQPAVFNGSKPVEQDQVMTDATRPLITKPRHSFVQEEVRGQGPMHLFSNQDVSFLEGHQGTLDTCRWNPSNQNPPTLATSSIDGTARIWTIPNKSQASISSVSLSCTPSKTIDKSVTALEWNHAGTLLATGSYDGQARIWTPQGRLRYTLSYHRGPIQAIKWNFSGEYMVTASADGQVAAWSLATGHMQQTWTMQAPVIDVDWLNNGSFITGCRDGGLHVWQLGVNMPTRRFEGHRSDINTVKWDERSTLIATGSDDQTVKLWAMTYDAPVFTLQKHTDSVFCVEFSPLFRNREGEKRLLASCSRDGSVCIWSALNGQLIWQLKHDRPIYTLNFSPDGAQIACGGDGGDISLWDITTGIQIGLYQSGSTAYNIKFCVNDPKGTSLAIAGKGPVGILLRTT